MKIDLEKVDLSQFDSKTVEALHRIAVQQLREQPGQRDHRPELDLSKRLKWPDTEKEEANVLASTNYLGGRILPVANDPLRRNS